MGNISTHAQVMPIGEAEGLAVWLQFLAGNDAIEIMPGKLQVFFPRNDDASSLILTQPIDAKTEWEYFFGALHDADEPRQLQLVFEFLKEMQFSLPELLNWLDKQEFNEGKMTHGRLMVARNKLFLQENEILI